jgi:hypothetical protein
MRRLLALLPLLATVAACGATTQHAAARDSIVRPAAATTGVTGAAAGTRVGVRHVFLIVLENESYTNTYVNNPNPYLGKTLQRQGTLLTQYYATGHVSLDNYVSMMSGQAPNVDTSTDCQTYARFIGAPALNAHGQEVGVGCVFPKNVPTFAGQLSAHKISWHGWMDQMGNTKGREQARCGVPTIVGGRDDTQTATASDQYAARHNPFVYFHSLLDNGLCRRHVAPLTGLAPALKKISTTPRFNFITPDLCDDGHDSPCTGKDARGSNAGGLKSVDHFLSVWIPRIKRSPAFKKNGLIIITSDESATSDTTRCCGEQAGPTDPVPGLTGPGGGRVGALVIGRCVKAGAHDATAYNHYALLKSLENLFGITKGGTDGRGHLGYAAVSSLRAFGPDVFARCRSTA